jgi:hypothetical protein
MKHFNRKFEVCICDYEAFYHEHCHAYANEKGYIGLVFVWCLRSAMIQIAEEEECMTK